jgi:hypothetical protein
MKARRCNQLDVSFLAQLACERFGESLPSLDAATREMPPAHVAVLDQKYATRVVYDESANS